MDGSGATRMEMTPPRAGQDPAEALDAQAEDAKSQDVEAQDIKAKANDTVQARKY